MNITEFTRTNAESLSKEIIEALAPLGEKYGVTFEHERAKYSAGQCVFQVVAKTGVGEDAGRVEFERFAHLADLAPTDFGRTIQMFDGNLYRITGIKVSNYTKPILVTRISDGKVFKTSAATVKRALSGDQPSTGGETTARKPRTRAKF